MSTLDISYPKMFRSSFITKEMDKFQFYYQCCGWKGPGDYAIPFPQSCCGRLTTKFNICDNPFLNGCQSAYKDRRNMIEVWRIICEFVRLIILIAVLYLLAIFFLHQVKKMRQQKRVNKQKLLDNNKNNMLLEETYSAIECECGEMEISSEWSSVESCGIESCRRIIELKKHVNNMETVPENSKQCIFEEDVSAEKNEIQNSISHSSESVSSDGDEVLVSSSKKTNPN